MKRRVILVLLLLVAGAIVNVAVAWVCSTLSHVEYDYSTSRMYTMTRPQMDVWWADPNGLLGDPATSTWWQGFDGTPPVDFFVTETQLRGYGLNGTAFGTEFFGWMILRSGWPCGGMAHAVEYQPVTHAANAVKMVGHSALQAPWREPLGMENAYLPLRPFWPGFAINTVFYSGVLWLLFAAPFALRRRRRIKRGLCPKCAYDLRGTPEATSCPECGNKVARTDVGPAL